MNKTMIHCRLIHAARRLGLATLLVLAMACGRLTAPRSDLVLALTPAKTLYQPGEAVTVNITLINKTAGALNVPALDRASVTFTLQPQGTSDPGALRFVEPVYSPKEPAGAARPLPGGATAASRLTRSFIFTTLSMERGAYVLAAVYTLPPAAPETPPRKIYAKAVRFTVAGERAFVHRYRDGILAREEAIALCAARAGAKPNAAEALLITDAAGYKKWWVNLSVGGLVRSWLVDPYLAVVVRETHPFTPE